MAKRGTPISSNRGKSKKSPQKISNSKKPKRIQYRSNLQEVISEILNLGLTVGHIERIRAYCPFWKLIDLVLDHKITLDSVKKSDIELAKLLDLFNKGTKTFDIGGISRKLVSQDVISAFEVTGGVQTVFTSKDKCIKTSFYKKFNGIQQLTTPIVLETLQKAVKSKGVNAANNVTQVMTLYFWTALFAPTKRATLCWGYNKILSCVEEINSYDWPRYIYDKLHQFIMGNPARKVTGCVMLIPYWIMENFPVASPRKENAELWCKKWNLQDLMGIGTIGVISQVLNTQVTVHNSQVSIANSYDKIVGDKSGDGGSTEDEEKYDEESNYVVDLGDDAETWDDMYELTQNGLMVENEKEHTISEKNMVIQLKEENLKLVAENEDLKATIKVRDSEIRALKKRKATLIDGEKGWTKLKKGLKDVMNEKTLKIAQMEKELNELQSSSSIIQNENKSLRRRLNNQGSHVKDLENENYRLIDENTELVVQKLTQVVYEEKDTSCIGVGFDGLAGDVKLKDNPGKLVLPKSESGSIDATNIEAVHTPKEGNTRIPPKKRTPLPFKLEEIKPVFVNSKLARIKAKVRKKALDKNIYVYGSEAEGRQGRKQKMLEEESDSLAIADTIRAKPISVVPILDEDFVAGPSRRRIIKKSEKETNRYQKMKHAKYVTKEHLDQLAAIEAEFGIGCVVVQFKHHPTAKVFLDNIESILSGWMMSSMVINSYAELLLLKHNNKEDPKFTIFESTIWSYVKSMDKDDDLDAQNKIEFIDEKLQQGKRPPNFYMFPIMTNKGRAYNCKPDHWMLLVHDFGDPKWNLYNSSKGRGAYNPYKEDAILLGVQAENNPYLGFVYTSFQERDTFISHGNTARLAKHHRDENLAKICGTIASDEKRHEVAYTKIMEKLFEIDPDGSVKAFASMMQKKIAMPAHWLYDGQDENLYTHFSSVAQKLGVYTGKDYADILEHLIIKWNVRNLVGLSSEGRNLYTHFSSAAQKLGSV